MTEEHEILADIFKDVFDKIQLNYDQGKLPHARTSVLPHVLTLAENILMPLLAKSKKDDNYEGQLFAISATFRWTIKRLMPIEKFIEHMNSEKMLQTDHALEDLTTRVGGVTKEDIDERMGVDDEKAKRSFPGVG